MRLHRPTLEAVDEMERLDEIEQEFNWKLRRMEERE